MTQALERRIYEKDYTECAICGCLRRRSGMEDITVREGNETKVKWWCADREWCLKSLAVREAGARKEMQG